MFSRCTGIEQSPELAATASASGKELRRRGLLRHNGRIRFNEDGDDEMVNVASGAALIDIVCGDILSPAMDWCSSDVVCFASMSHHSALRDGIIDRARTLRPGAMLIMIGTALPVSCVGIVVGQ